MDELLAMQQKGYTMRIWRYLTFIFAITTRYTRPIFLTLFLLFGLPGSVYADLLTSLDEVLDAFYRERLLELSFGVLLSELKTKRELRKVALFQ